MKRQNRLTLLVILLTVGMLVAVADPVVAEHQAGQEFTVTVIDHLDLEFIDITDVSSEELETVLDSVEQRFRGPFHD